MVFVLLGVDTPLGNGCGIWEHSHSFREVKWRVISRLYEWDYNMLRFPIVTDEFGIVVATAGYLSR